MNNEERSGAGGTGGGAAGGPGDPQAGMDPRRAYAGAPSVVIDGRYELLEPIGSGGMGEVWKAHDRRLRRFVAVKGMLDPNAMTAGNQVAAMQRARREAEAIAKIEHQNVVSVHDQVETDNQVWIVMKLLEARSLADLLRAEGSLAVPRAANIGLQILRGLRAVHAASVVHRDVKPGNVLVRDDGLVILVDFGIATFEGAAQVTRVGSVIGTPPYLAPEIFAPGSVGPTAASDLWALGVTLYQMVEGRSPFAGQEVWEVQESIRQSPEPAFRYAGPLAPVIRGLLVTDPDQRLDAATADAMVGEVLGGDSFAPHTPSVVPATHPPTKPPEPAPAAEASEPDPVPEVPAPAAEAPNPGPDPTPATPEPGPEPGTGTEPAPAATPAASTPDPDPSPEPSVPEPGPAVSGPATPAPAPVAPSGERPRFGRGLKVAALAVSVALLATAGWLVTKNEDSGGKADQADQARQDDRGGGPAEKWKDSKPTLNIGVKNDQPGLSLYNKKTDTYAGYDVDLAYAIAERMGYREADVEFTPVTTDDRSTALKRKKVDLVIASYSITDDRKNTAPDDYSVDFAGPYYLAGRGFLVREKSSKYDIKDSSDLLDLGVEVCTARNSTYGKVLAEKGFTMKKSQPSTYEGCKEELLDVKSDVYAVASDDVVLAGYAKANPGKVRRLNNIRGAEAYGVAMLPENRGLKDEVCRALKDVMDGKDWEDLYTKHLAGMLNSKTPPEPPALTECPKG
ncbi:transporter substrate-binding domain-containing protein [Streptomyces sp. AJS327]|uniref:serine/threonine-protein kinase n=1 Tax=Streptomyces sp. AJS327 TaxID=2545265 RepID=UPI0015DF555E|nr:serine/threonine-protein kinase [Streptomyces sp. AJS327]MBA0049662.1 transporter substrate-binding domain-containing protein [Streptomyces sp. AJS327]